MATYLGVDGCPSGWFAVWIEEGVLQGRIFTSLSELCAAHQDAARILIDIPLGLLADTERNVESRVRARLGPRRSSVFPVPCFAAAFADDYPSANAINGQQLGKGLSKQAWFLTPKICEANSLLADNSRARSIFGESHPELTFAHFAGAPMANNKKSEEGVIERLSQLKSRLPEVEAFVAQQLLTYKRRELVLDDCLDALALLAAAEHAVPMDDPASQLGWGGVPIRMWVPAS